MIPRKSNGPSAAESSEAEVCRAEAMALIRAQRTMVLATSMDGVPWAAPVYYVYSTPGFYFFSSPTARHIEQGIAAGSVAAAIFRDSDQWEQIQGVQMTGAIQVIQKKTELLKVGARFVLKFPFAEPFLQSSPKQNATTATPKVGDRVKLYAFLPRESYYVNNRMGFGKRWKVQLQAI